VNCIYKLIPGSTTFTRAEVCAVGLRDDRLSPKVSGEPLKRFDIVNFAGCKQRVNDYGLLRCIMRSGKYVILATQVNRPEAVLGQVIVNVKL
jgi:hypothetical protein